MNFQIQVITVTDDSKINATPLSQFLQNDGARFANRPSFDVDETLGILPFSSGTTGEWKPNSLQQKISLFILLLQVFLKE